MTVQRREPRNAALDVLDRVLDKGIVIEASVSIRLAGIELVGVDVRVIVASIETYLRLSERLSTPTDVPGPAPATPHTSTALAHRAKAPCTRVARRHATVRLCCQDGCTFTRASRRVPRAVHCPYDAGHLCRVQRV
jgi:hypothetical protein